MQPSSVNKKIHNGKITKWIFNAETGGFGEIMPVVGATDRIDYNGSYIVFSASVFPKEQRTSLMINRRVIYSYTRDKRTGELHATEARLA